MMRQLGITRLRPGADGWAKAGAPGAANYDPALANPSPGLAGRADPERRTQGHERRGVVA